MFQFKNTFEHFFLYEQASENKSTVINENETSNNEDELTDQIVDADNTSIENTSIENTSTDTNDEQVEETFTQSQVDKIIQKRLKAEKLKYKDYDQIVEKATTLESTLKEVEKKYKDLAATKKQDDLVYKIDKAATAKNLDSALALKLINVKEVQYNDNGEPTNIDDLIGQIIKDHPNVVRKVQTPDNNIGTNDKKENVNTQSLYKSRKSTFFNNGGVVLPSNLMG